MMPVSDVFQRPLSNLRLSVTDRCNIRCQYCMPEKDYVWLPKDDILQFEEINRLADVFIRVGVSKVRLTGGEPLLRRDLPDLIRMLAAKRGIKDLALTTNGVLLAEQAQALHAAGLHRVTVSIDTLRPDRFEALTRSRALPQVQEGITEASRLFRVLKLDAVVLRGVNEDELAPLIEYAREMGAEMRFIEYMDVGGATRCSKRFSDTTARSIRSPNTPRRRPIASASLTAPYSASFRRPPSLSAATATEVD
jgi:cyclic pyranopterin phosphate synthase